MNCDPLARIYRCLEHIAFGSKLERQRFAFLQEAEGVRRALLLGEGDGRFLIELASRNPSVEIDCVEASSKMIERARARISDAQIFNPGRIAFHQRDARSVDGLRSGYDLVVTNFFLDCFCTEEIGRLIPAIRALCMPQARWLIAEFDLPPDGWRHWHARLWLAVMYCFFGIATRLRIRQLPEYRQALKTAGFSMQERKLTMADFISAEMWQLSSTRRTGLEYPATSQSHAAQQKR